MSYHNFIDSSLNLSLDHDFGDIQGLSKKFLCAVAQGKVDIKALLEYELAARGYDAEGNWVGFSARTNSGTAK
jgi:hypothetical protein